MRICRYVRMLSTLLAAGAPALGPRPRSFRRSKQNFLPRYRIACIHLESGKGIRLYALGK
jgi:hypothetical protein